MGTCCQEFLADAKCTKCGARFLSVIRRKVWFAKAPLEFTITNLSIFSLFFIYDKISHQCTYICFMDNMCYMYLELSTRLMSIISGAHKHTFRLMDYPSKLFLNEYKSKTRIKSQGNVSTKAQLKFEYMNGTIYCQQANSL